MRVSIVSCVFPPEPVASARTSAQIAEALATQGHDVTVLAPYPNRPGGKTFDGYSRRLYSRTIVGSRYTVVHCFGFLSPRSQVLSRLLENISFGITSGISLLWQRHPDVIYSNTWPILATGIVATIAWLRGAPLVLSVQDMYPESLVAQRRTADRSLWLRISAWADGRIARGARHVIVISRHLAQVYTDKRRLASARIHVVPNWADSTHIDVASDGNAVRDELGIPRDAFLLAFGGNVGVAADVQTVIRAMGELRYNTRVWLLVAGAGSQLAMCQALARQLSLANVTFYSPWPSEKTSSTLRAADLLVLSTQGDQSMVSLPSKLISYMLAARPIVAAVRKDSEVATVISESACGCVVEPDDPRRLALCISRLIELNTAELDRLGQSGRDYALQHFVKDVCLPKILGLIESAAPRTP